jgi:hypothetical protein
MHGARMGSSLADPRFRLQSRMWIHPPALPAVPSPGSPALALARLSQPRPTLLTPHRPYTTGPCGYELMQCRHPYPSAPPNTRTATHQVAHRGHALKWSYLSSVGPMGPTPQPRLARPSPALRCYA